ncbi:threonine synthase [Aggregicoccus sp. 17bor-14]|uniref:threonine synthase n=1 Tax=Myxococcaceae TaxID=31 RepID=UPI00129D1DD3|nr:MULTISPECIES: threonine synthase [Myxococcaceae]MBF5044007.1 threonine synthase [Simulacricoccus sp. 17bor-14]MRI89758.1 threonine synthase [Aggregicoccus sp. 17bor-14]
MSRALHAAYVCSEGCGFGAPLTEIVYRCPRCGALLDVQQDLEALRATPAAEWRRRFEGRSALARGPLGSGVWSKQEWVYPQLPAEHIVTLGEGHTPLKGLPRMAQRLGLGSLELKECGVSPTGSFKDWGMTVLVSAVQHLRALGAPVRAVACASTGDTSAALSAYAAAAGIPAVVFLPRDKVSLAQLAQPIANGARVLSLDTDFDGCMRLVQAVTESKDAGLYLANSMNALRIEGQKMVAVELAQQLGWEVPDWVVIPGGNLGNASALGKGFELLHALGLISRRPRLAVAQAERANPLARAFRGGFRELLPMQAGETLASAIRIGHPVSFRRAVRTLQAFDGVVEDATEAELAQAAAEADREGTFTCPHTGVALAAVARLARAGTIAPGARVVVVSTAHGLKFTDFKVGYHRGSLPGVSSEGANPPLELPADLGAVREALASLG